ncbi:MAG TPA: hypothetical protein VLB84_11635 [Bacteroidia bacterium]|nr:hypothetical protein [Bacteroidia bacterium]
MNYATEYPIGSYQRTRTETTTSFTPTVGRICPLDATAKRCKPNSERQAAIRTGNNAANGFLKSVFLPKLKTAQSVQPCKKRAKTERDFYKSLSFLAEHYSIEPMLSQGYGYPYNMVLAMWDMKNKLKRTTINWDRLRLVQSSKKTYLVSEERYDTGTNLYYIPIIPLFQMLKDPKRKKTAQLLISVCSYLYHIADIPYYRQDESYLYWMYEMLNDWIDDMDEDEYYKNKSELRQAECIGDKIKQKLFNRINLKVFEKRLSGFKSRNELDRECHKIACNAFALYTEYPSATIFRNAWVSKEDPCDDDYRDEVIGMEKYISFVADTKGYLYESLSDSINNEFNEYGAMEEPTICKHFDGNKITTANLDFENRLFALLEDLCSLLYNCKATEK